MRLLFIPKNDEAFCPSGDLLEIYLCQICGVPEQFKEHFCMIARHRYPRAELGCPDECFMCGHHFDGNEAATEVVIELTKPKEMK
jgi:hypothetical protein